MAKLIKYPLLIRIGSVASIPMPFMSGITEIFPMQGHHHRCSIRQAPVLLYARRKNNHNEFDRFENKYMGHLMILFKKINENKPQVCESHLPINVQVLAVQASLDCLDSHAKYPVLSQGGTVVHTTQYEMSFHSPLHAYVLKIRTERAGVPEERECGKSAHR